MRYMHTLLFTLFLAVATGCAPAVQGDEELGFDGTEQALTAGAPVRLLWAKTDSGCVTYRLGTCENNLAQAVLKGYVEVDNLAYNKQVTVRYQAQGGEWVDAVARYVAPSGANSEAWYFETEPKTYTDRLGTEFPFAIRYSVGGQTYWDNNAGQNYRVGGGPRTFSPSFVLEATNLALTELRWGLDQVNAQVALKNLGAEKNVSVVYSTDGWRTVQTAQGTFQYSSSGYELWSLAMPVGVEATSIELAVSYTVNGQTYWDSNFGRDYALTKPDRL